MEWLLTTTRPQRLASLGWNHLRAGENWDDLAAVCIILVASYYSVRSQLNGKDPYYHLWFETPQSGLRAAAATTNSDVAQALADSGKEIVIFFGSQTGTAQRLAYQLSQAIDQRFSKKALLASLSDYDSASLNKIDSGTRCIFVLSTYGEGDPPDDAISFSDWLNSSHTGQPLERMTFGMLGLGSSNYKHYNQFARHSFEALKNLGATPLLDLGLADDAKGLAEEDFFNWATLLFDSGKLGMKEQIRPYSPALALQITPEVLDPEQTAQGPVNGMEANKRRGRSTLSSLHLVPVKSVQELTAPPNRSVVRIDLDISQFLELKYITGDHVAVWPENEDVEVLALASSLGISESDLTKRLVITTEDSNSSWNHLTGDSTTIHTLFKHRLEIAAPISRDFIIGLKQFAPSEHAKKRLQSVSQDQDSFMQFRVRNRITLASVLRYASAGPWNLPLSFVLERVPALKPRYYSISSASSVHPRQISITVSENTLNLGDSGEVVKGLASHYLKNKLGEASARTAYCQIRRSKFRAPFSPSRPMVLVATGSGIAPFRGFVQHLAKQADLGKEIGTCVLFFGCRTPKDELYSDELAAARTRLDDNLKVIPAYSRVEGEKAYVQDKVKAEHELVSKLLVDDEAGFYICGSTSMSRDVKTAVCEIIRWKTGWSKEEFSDFEASQRRSNHWQEDVWG